MISEAAYSSEAVEKLFNMLIEHETEWATHFGVHADDLASYIRGAMRIELTLKYDEDHPNLISTSGLFDGLLKELDPEVKNKFMGGSHMHCAPPGKEGNVTHRLIIMVNAIVVLLISLMPVSEPPLFDADQRKFYLIDYHPYNHNSTVLCGTITVGTAEARSVSSLRFNWPRFPLSVAMRRLMLLYGIRGKDICAILVIAILLFGEWRINPMEAIINLRNLGFGVDWLSNLGSVFGGRVDLYIASFIEQLGNNDDGNP